MNLHCPVCGHFLCEVEQPRFGLIRLKCPHCRKNVHFRCEDETLVVLQEVSTRRRVPPETPVPALSVE